MPKDWYKHAQELVSAYVRKDMPEDIKRLVAYARADLNFGPEHNGLDPDEPFPGFETATTKLAAWLRDNMPSELWVDVGCDDIATSAPEGEEIDGEWQEPFLEETFHFERVDILRAAFGELEEYLH